PDDPALRDYWATRRRKAPLPITSTSLRLYRAQNGCCPICKTALLRVDQQPPTPNDWERWLATARDTITIVTADTASDEAEHRLLHAHCRHGTRPGTLPTTEPTRPAGAGCGQSRTSGSEEGRAPQGARPIRPERLAGIAFTSWRA